MKVKYKFLIIMIKNIQYMVYMMIIFHDSILFQEPSRKHVFSHHDNRQAFLNDALIFQQVREINVIESS